MFPAPEDYSTVRFFLGKKPHENVLGLLLIFEHEKELYSNIRRKLCSPEISLTMIYTLFYK